MCSYHECRPRTFAIPFQEAAVVAPVLVSEVTCFRDMEQTHSLTSLHSGASEADMVDVTGVCDWRGSGLGERRQ